MQTKQIAVLIFSLAIVLFISGALVIFKPGVPVQPVPTVKQGASPQNATYVFSGEPITFVEGYYSREAAPGSASMETFRVFGEPVYGDLDGDGDADATLMFTQESGGSGTFFYTAVALKNGESYIGTNALFLGDRIAPQTIVIDGGTAVVNYADRNPDESFAVPASIGKSVWIHIDPETREIGEAVKDFEGEVDLSSMPLTKHSWEWVRSVANGNVIIPKQPGVFTLTFTPDNRVSIGTDCNSMGGSYELRDYTLTFGQMMSTLMYCEGSEEGEFASMLSMVHRYAFTEGGELLLYYGKEGVATFIEERQERGPLPGQPILPEPVEPSPLPPGNPTQLPPTGGCFVGGCSGQLCTDTQDMVTTCEWREEYSCYRNATCERQPSGNCGWTDSTELRACLSAGGSLI